MRSAAMAGAVIAGVLVTVTGGAALLALLLGSFGLAGALAGFAALVILLVIITVSLCDPGPRDDDDSPGDRLR